MPFNLQTFRTRALTAIIFVLVMLAGLLWNQWSFLILFSLIHFGCWIEYQKLVSLIDPAYGQIDPIHKYGIMLTGWGFMLWMTDDNYQTGGFFLNKTGWWIFVVSLIVFGISIILFFKKSSPRLLAHSVMGLVYISLSWGLMMRLWGNLHQTVFIGENWIKPVILIASIWINDTMAYLVGSLIGKTPLSPVSPKKTWEGTIGGALLAVLVVGLVGYYSLHFPIKPLLLISLTGAIAGTLGDLFESKLKRLANVKDSGSIMPGHGGFLDRFDSLLLATTALWLVLYFTY